MVTTTYTNSDVMGFRIQAGTTHALMIPGFMGTPAELRPLAGALAGSGISVRSVLLPGFGPDLDNLPRVRLEQWLEASCEAWREEQAHAQRRVLIGFSMGGAIAAAVAHRAGMPDALILLAPHVRFADPRAMALPLLKHVMREFNPLAKADFSDHGIRAGFQEIMPDADLDDPATQAMLRKQAAIPTHALDELGRAGRLAQRAAPSITSPTLIVQGSEDKTSLPAYSRAFAKRIAGPVDFETVPGSHMLVDPLHPGHAATREAVLRHALGEDQP